MSSIASPTTTIRCAAILRSRSSSRSREKRTSDRSAIPQSALASWQYALSPDVKRQSDTPHEPRLSSAALVLIVVDQVRAAVGVQLPRAGAPVERGGEPQRPLDYAHEKPRRRVVGGDGRI